MQKTQNDYLIKSKKNIHTLTPQKQNKKDNYDKITAFIFVNKKSKTTTTTTTTTKNKLEENN